MKNIIKLMTKRRLLVATLFLSLCINILAEVIWRPFSDDSPWNTPISSSDKVDSNSDIYIDYINEHFKSRSLISYGQCRVQVNIHEWSIPVYFVDNNIKKIDVQSHYEWGESNFIPIPKDAKPAEAADKSLCIVNKEEGKTWGVWELKGSYPNYTAGNTGVATLSSDGVIPNGTRESGFPIIAGLIRPEEIKAGEIRHALVFSFDARDGYDQFVYPATRGADFDSTPANKAMPMGTRLQLDPNFDTSGYPRGARIVMEALKKYGMYLGDENDSKSMSLYFQSNGNWKGLFENDDMRAINQLKASDFKVINYNKQNR
jgi:hypothetical protein